MNWTLIGILCALGAFLSRGIGDFLIQRSTRKIGNWETLFVVAFSASIILLPFVYHDFDLIFSYKNILVLSAVAIIFFVMSLLNFESLKRGKISVVEPIFTLEIPIAIFLAFFFLQESISWPQGILMAIVMMGIVMISIQSHHFSKRSWLEAGVLLAVAAAIFEGASNFIVGFSARLNNPLLTIWFLSAVSAIVSFVYLMKSHSLKSLWQEISLHKKLLTWLGLLDNAGRIFFAFAVSLIPIGIATSLSEGYIALASLLGFLINKEKLSLYQKIGFLITIVAVIILAVTQG